LRPQRIENTATDASELFHRDHHALIIYGLTPLESGGLRSLVVHQCSIDFCDSKIEPGNTGVAIRFGSVPLAEAGWIAYLWSDDVNLNCRSSPGDPRHTLGDQPAQSRRETGGVLFAQLVIPHPDDPPDGDFFPDGDLERSPSPLHHSGIAQLGSLDDFRAVRPPLGEAH